MPWSEKYPPSSPPRGRNPALARGSLLAGENYGQGSSREQAALAPRYLGIWAIIARSFARIHLANLVNLGLLPFVFCHPDDYRLVSREDVLQVDTRELREGETSRIRNIPRGTEIAARLPLSPEELAIIKAGDRLNWLRQKDDIR